jgi:tRNA U34 5-carboxymethylaminomethyl modifying enzyme MnmG/GidA
LAQAKRISGVNPSDVQIVQVLLSAGRLPMHQIATP